MQTYDVDYDGEEPRKAGVFRCPACAGPEMFWIAEGQEYDDLPDLECSSCGFMFVKVRNEKTNTMVNPITAEMREEAMRKMITKLRRSLINAGYVKEDVDNVLGAS